MPHVCTQLSCTTFFISEGVGLLVLIKSLGLHSIFSKIPQIGVSTAQRPTQYRPKIELEKCKGFLETLTYYTSVLGPWVKISMIGSPEWFHFKALYQGTWAKWKMGSPLETLPAGFEVLGLRPASSHYKDISRSPKPLSQISQIGFDSPRGVHLTLSTNISPYPQDRRQIWAVPL